jgi:hypothetical protein
MGWSGLHTANQNGGDLYSYDNTMMRPARQVLCDPPEDKITAKMLIEEYI